MCKAAPSGNHLSQPSAGRQLSEGSTETPDEHQAKMDGYRGGPGVASQVKDDWSAEHDYAVFCVPLHGPHAPVDRALGRVAAFIN
mmetsp:Transcript_29091/g.66927  ORF Transcript_29091/g.66927 Transcript_29091/m.66927 type:complete len:85 (-) Transcript_29091:43-297(-)